MAACSKINQSYLVDSDASDDVLGNWIDMEKYNGINIQAFFGSGLTGTLYVDATNLNTPRPDDTTTQYVPLLELDLPYTVDTVTQTSYCFEVFTSTGFVRLRWVAAEGSVGDLSAAYVAKSQG